MLPVKPLVITGADGKPFAYGDLPLEEAMLFEPGGFSRRAVIAFLKTYTNWTAAEIRAIQEKDLIELWQMIVKKVDDLTVPLVK
jgi:hypothetical protein